MELRTFQIDLDSLEEIKPQQFPFDVGSKQADLEYFAQSIIKLGGLLRIPVVERTGIDSYRLVEGYFDYLAYLKARELEPELPDRIRVFIMEKDNSEAAQTQLRVLKNLEASKINSDSEVKSVSSSAMDLRGVQNQVDNLKLLVENKFKKIEDTLLSLSRNTTSNANGYTEVRKSLEDIKAQIDELKPDKVNLLSATSGEIYNALVQAGLSDRYIKPALEAIEYWKESNRVLSWGNLKNSATSGKSDKIKGFGDSTLRTLKQIAEIK